MLKKKKYKYVICKDILEHIEPDRVKRFLSSLNACFLFVIVPLGDGQKYVIPQMELDKTHKIKQTLSWWVDMIESTGAWKVIKQTTQIDGMKQAWNHYKDGHAFITARRV